LGGNIQRQNNAWTNFSRNFEALNWLECDLEKETFFSPLGKENIYGRHITRVPIPESMGGVIDDNICVVTF
jgi:hypothetical protein